MTNQKLVPGLSALGEPEVGNGEVCIANISPAERRKRLLSGIIPFVIAAALLVWLIAINANLLWRLPLFLPFFVAGIGFFQWRDKTCVGLSRRGSRNINGIVEKIENELELAQVRLQARHVTNKALLVAVLLTLVAQIV